MSEKEERDITLLLTKLVVNPTASTLFKSLVIAGMMSSQIFRTYINAKDM